MGKKIKSEVSDDVSEIKEEDITYEERVLAASPISKPMATKKLSKKINKLIKKAYNLDKKNVLIGLKNVQKELRKNPSGITIIAGDVHPIDIICHIPMVCENQNVPYCYLPSRVDLAKNVNHVSCCLVLMIKPNPEYDEHYQAVLQGIRKLPPPV